MYIVANTMQS